jgi:hypothetical protein
MPAIRDKYSKDPNVFSQYQAKTINSDFKHNT